MPEDKLTWKPHEKSMTAGQLALHLAQVPGNVVKAVLGPTAQVPSFGNYPQPASREEVLKTLDESIATVKEALSSFDDATLKATWRLMQGDSEILATPRQQFLRDIMLNHWYQHRGQFSVYLRLLDVPVPASWGPSADEAPAFANPREAVAV